MNSNKRVPVQGIVLSARFRGDDRPEVVLEAEPGTCLWERAQAVLDEWASLIPPDETAEITVYIEWEDGEAFEGSLCLAPPAEPSLLENRVLAVHLVRYLEYQAGSRDRWAAGRAMAEVILPMTTLRTVEELEEKFGARYAERAEWARGFLEGRELPAITAYREERSDEAAALYHLLGREVALHSLDAYAWQDALRDVLDTPTQDLSPVSQSELQLLLQSPDQRVRLVGMQAASLGFAPEAPVERAVALRCRA